MWNASHAVSLNSPKKHMVTIHISTSERRTPKFKGMSHQPAPTQQHLPKKLL